jgi:hypothetical protein
MKAPRARAEEHSSSELSDDELRTEEGYVDRGEFARIHHDRWAKLYTALAKIDSGRVMPDTRKAAPRA